MTSKSRFWSKFLVDCNTQVFCFSLSWVPSFVRIHLQEICIIVVRNWDMELKQNLSPKSFTSSWFHPFPFRFWGEDDIDRVSVTSRKMITYTRFRDDESLIVPAWYWSQQQIQNLHKKILHLVGDFFDSLRVDCVGASKGLFFGLLILVKHNIVNEWSLFEII